MKRSKQKGITLITLVITIIVLLILAAVSIATLTGKNGILLRANELKIESRGAVVQEEVDIWKINKETDRQLKETEGKAEKKEEFLERLEKEKKLTKEEKREIEETGKTTIGDREIIFWGMAEQVEDGKIEIGAYVKYEPNKASAENILKELEKYSGSSGNTSDTIVQENLNWRILDVKNGRVRLISEEPTTSTIGIYGARGYNNAVYLIDTACKELYSNTDLSEEVKNLKIEDIEEKLTYDYTQYKNAYVDTGKYGGFKINPYTTNTYYPVIYIQEKNNGVGGKKQEGKLELSEQQEPIDGEFSTTTSLGVTQTYWNKVFDTNDFISEKYYELFMNKDGNDYPIYWLSSRCINIEQNYAKFCIYRMSNMGGLGAWNLFLSNNTSITQTYMYPIRPVITLNEEIDVTGGDGKTVETAYTIK